MSSPSTAHRRAAAAALTAAAALVLASCSTPAAEGEAAPGVTDDTVTIGTHTPLTGPAAAGYSEISAAASAYFDYLNDNGGVHGRTVEFIVKDDGYNPATTQTVVRELVEEDDVFAVLGGLGTPTHSSVIDYLNQREVPDLFVASGATMWNEPEEYPWTFGYNADYIVESGALAQYALDEFPGATVCLLGQDDDFGDDFIAGAEAVLGADGLAEVQRYSVSNQDVAAQIGAMQAAGCEINLLATINGFTALAVGTAAQLGYFPKWFSSSSGADYPTLVGYLGDDLAPKLLQGLVGVNYLPAAQGDSEWTALFQRINEEYNSGAAFNGNTVFGMSLAYQFAEALEAAGENPTRQGIVDAVTSGDLAGTGIVPLAFADDSHAAYIGVGITQVDQGVQDYVGATYVTEGGAVEAVEADPAPFTGEGIPGGE